MADRQEVPYWHHMRKNAYEILNVRSEIKRREPRPAEWVEMIGGTLAYPKFIIFFVSVHLLWLVLNLPVFPWFKPWDPYPFAFLATLTSAEAPFIALLVLMYQRRYSRISELREEIALQVSLHMERQMTAMLRQMGELQEKAGVESEVDPDLLKRLKQELDADQLLESVRDHLRQDEETERKSIDP